MKELDEAWPKHFGEENAYYKIVYQQQNAVFYFENRDKNKTIEVELNLELENLEFPGNPDQKSFKILLRPEYSCFRRLNVIDKTKRVSVKARKIW